MSTRNKTLGISQLELLLSLALMAMLAVFIANAMNFTRQVTARASQNDPIVEEALARERLRSWVERIPLEFSGAVASERFSGTEHEMTFSSLAHDELFWAGALTEFTLKTVIEEVGPTLSLFAIGQSGPEAQPTQHVFKIAIISSEPTIRYFGRLNTEETNRWHREWSDPVQLPLLVKLEWNAADGTPSPPLTLQPAKTARQRYMSLSSLVPPG